MAKKKSQKTANDIVQYDLFGAVIKTPEIDNEDYSTKDKTSPFDIIKMMFQNRTVFDNLHKTVLERNAFMIMRTFAIMYPIQAAYLNYSKINQSEVIKYIADYLRMYNPGTRVPQWVYTKGAKRADETPVGADIEVSKQQKEQYAIFYHYSMKDINDGLKFNYKAVAVDIIRVDRMLNPPNNIISSEKVKS